MFITHKEYSVTLKLQTHTHTQHAKKLKLSLLGDVLGLGAFGKESVAILPSCFCPEYEHI